MNHVDDTTEPSMEEGLENLALDLMEPDVARKVIRHAIDDPSGFRHVHAALTRWTWRILIERRLDVDLRSWHRLLLDTAASIQNRTIGTDPTDRPNHRHDPKQAADRIRELADLIRLSIQAAEASMPAEFGTRPHIVQTLRCLSSEADLGVGRNRIAATTGSSLENVSRTLTLMAANGFVERMARITTPAYRPTTTGMKLVENGKERT